MKKFLSLAALLLVCVMASAQSMKMVIDARGKAVGRLVKVNQSTYTIDVQDTYDVPKAGKRVVTFSAEKGQGIVYRNQTRTGNINVRKEPNLKAIVVAKIKDEPGTVPATYPCLGKENGWYKIRIDGKVGFVREDMAEWDGMDTF